MADTKQETELRVLWECLNTVYFTEEAAVEAHRKMLLKCRRDMANTFYGGVLDAHEIECGTLEHYAEVRKRKRQRAKALERELDAKISKEMADGA